MKRVPSLFQDELLGRVVRNSAHLFSSNAAGLALSVLQGILAARMLGAAGYGLIAVVMSYTSTINGLLSFRMRELVVRYGGEYLERNEKAKAAALLKVSGFGRGDRLSVGVLYGRSERRAGGTICDEDPRHGMDVCDLRGGTALQLQRRDSHWRSANHESDPCARNDQFHPGALFGGYHCGNVHLAPWSLGSHDDRAIRRARRLPGGEGHLGHRPFRGGLEGSRSGPGRGWRAAKRSELPSFRELLGFAVSSNLSATAILVFRESEVLWVGLLLNNEAAGLYKVAYTIVGLLSVPADPLILSVYPEANRLVVQRAWGRLRSFLKAITGLAFFYNAVLAMAFIVPRSLAAFDVWRGI